MCSNFLLSWRTWNWVKIIDEMHNFLLEFKPGKYRKNPDDDAKLSESQNVKAIRKRWVKIRAKLNLLVIEEGRKNEKSSWMWWNTRASAETEPWYSFISTCSACNAHPRIRRWFVLHAHAKSYFYFAIILWQVKTYFHRKFLVYRGRDSSVIAERKVVSLKDN